MALKTYVTRSGETLVSRSQRLADADHIRAESSETKHILRTNAFTSNTINFTTNTINRVFHEKAKSMDTTTCVTKEYLPVIKSRTDKIGRILRKHQIQTIFSADRKIGQILNNPKDKVPQEVQGVDEILYRNCDLSYIANRGLMMETGR
ncbi:hypothetical protein Trydic_g23401 [Trypoxylus dichotomus]